MRFSAKIDSSMYANYWTSAEYFCRRWWLEFGGPGMHLRRRQRPFFAHRTTSNTPSIKAAACQVLSTGSLVDQGHRFASYDTSRRCWLREKTMKCLWQDASTLRQRHLTACSDKAVAYVTKRLLDVLYCFSQLLYTRRIARPLCDSRATCW